MKLQFKPASKAGMLAVLFLLLSIGFSVAGGIISQVSGNTVEYPNPINCPLLGTFIYLHFAFAMAASAVGLYALYGKKDRALLVYLAIPWGIFLFLGVTLLLIGALLGPLQS